MQLQDAAEVYLGSVQTLKYGALKNGETKVNLPVNMRRLLTNAKYATANSTAGAAVADLKPEKGEALSESCSCHALRSPAPLHSLLMQNSLYLLCCTAAECLSLPAEWGPLYIIEAVRDLLADQDMVVVTGRSTYC